MLTARSEYGRRIDPMVALRQGDLAYLHAQPDTGSLKVHGVVPDRPRRRRGVRSDGA